MGASDYWIWINNEVWMALEKDDGDEVVGTKRFRSQ